MKIDVTWGDILFGKVGDPYRCALARATRRAGVANPAVGPSGISFGYDNSVRLPESALRFLWRFDAPFRLFRLFRCRPFSFEITVPEVLAQNCAEIRAGVDVIGLGDVDCFVSTAKPDR